jgi:hypothetical protein
MRRRMKYEYKVEFVPGQGADPEAIEHRLNEFAEQGFRCIHAGSNPNGSWTLLFEREQPE